MYLETQKIKTNILVKFDEMPEVLILNTNERIYEKLTVLINKTL